MSTPESHLVIWLGSIFFSIQHFHPANISFCDLTCTQYITFQYHCICWEFSFCLIYRVELKFFIPILIYINVTIISFPSNQLFIRYFYKTEKTRIFFVVFYVFTILVSVSRVNNLANMEAMGSLFSRFLCHILLPINIK